MPEPEIDDAEQFFRRVRNRPELYSIVDGQVRVSSSAFNDPYRKPSLNRRLLMRDPVSAQIERTDGVLIVLASEIRQISIACEDHVRHSGNIEPDPVDVDRSQGIVANPAHCIVTTNPPLCSEGRFKKLKEALARAATARGWAIAPT